MLATGSMWKSHDNFGELVLFFHLYVGFGDGTHVTMLLLQVSRSVEPSH